MVDKTNSENLPRADAMEKRAETLRDQYLTERLRVEPRKMLSIGQPHVGSMVITDSPQKRLYQRVQWFDVRRMTYREASNLANGLALLGDAVMFDCFGQIVMGGRIKDSGGHEQP